MACRTQLVDLKMAHNTKIILCDELDNDAQWELSICGGEIKIIPNNNEAKLINRNKKIDSIIEDKID